MTTTINPKLVRLCSVLLGLALLSAVLLCCSCARWPTAAREAERAAPSTSNTAK